MVQHGYLTENSQAGNARQRAFVCGYMRRDHAARFLRHMALAGRNAIYVPACGTVDLIPSALDIPLTLGKNQQVTTHMSSMLPTVTDAAIRRQIGLDRNDPAVYVLCWDSQWGPSGLFEDIIDALRR